MVRPDGWTRGEANNNPGNIERNATKWKGMDPDQSGDSRFVVYLNPMWGIRALAKTLLTYSTLYPEGTPGDIDTVREIINRWAPPVENDTGAYVKAVAQEVGVNPDQRIQVDDHEILRRLVMGIIRHENGRVIYTDADLDDGIDRALA
jgi:hypothetical protein